MSELLRSDYVAAVRRNRVEYGDVYRTQLKRRAICRCCGEVMPKGTDVLRFSWDFAGYGSYTAIECSMHPECTPARPATPLDLGRQQATGGQNADV